MRTKLVSSLQIGAGASVGSALFQALPGGIDNIDYYRAITVGVVVTIVFLLIRAGSSQKEQSGG